MFAGKTFAFVNFEDTEVRSEWRSAGCWVWRRRGATTTPNRAQLLRSARCPRSAASGTALLLVIACHVSGPCAAKSALEAARVCALAPTDLPPRAPASMHAARRGGPGSARWRRSP